VLSILTSLDRDRYDAEVAGPTFRPETGEGATFVSDVTALGVRFHPVDMRRAVSPRHDLSALRQLRALIRRGCYDIVHGHSSKGGFLARVGGWLTGTPTVYTPNALYFLQLPSGIRRTAYLMLERLARPMTTRFIAVSPSERDLALREKLAQPERLLMIPNGIGEDAFDRPPDARDRVRDELNIPTDAVVVGCAARLTAQKDPIVLVRAVAELAGRISQPLYLIWAGDGALAPEVARAARAGGIEHRCRFVGFRRDMRSVMCAFDIFALPSRYEGLPYALLEAMAVGLPVVATDVVGTRDVVTHGVTGYLVPPGDPSRLAAALEPLVEDADLRTQLGSSGRKIVAERFTLAEMVRRLEALYGELAAPRMAPLRAEPELPGVGN
jgi:glycosyltransferase involved in cell wall biosynthesis